VSGDLSHGLPLSHLENGSGFFSHVGFGMMLSAIEQIPLLLFG